MLLASDRISNYSGARKTIDIESIVVLVLNCFVEVLVLICVRARSARNRSSLVVSHLILLQKRRGQQMKMVLTWKNDGWISWSYMVTPSIYSLGSISWDISSE